jgi:hypothetical protein
MSTNTTALSTSRFVYRVLPVDGLWKVAMPGNSVGLSMHADKQAAVARAVALARRDGGLDVLVFGPDGVLETEFSTQPSV